MLTKIKGDEESRSFKAAEESIHKAMMLDSDTNALSFNPLPTGCIF
jgi:hypothetical protein